MEKRINNDLAQAIKEQNAVKCTALREIKTAIMNFKTSATYKGTCTDADILGIIQKLAKQHQESADIYTKAGRPELAQPEIDQNVYIEEYLPKMLSNDEVATMIDTYISDNSLKGMQNMKLVMNYLKETIPNQYDPKFVSGYAKSKLM